MVPPLGVVGMIRAAAEEAEVFRKCRRKALTEMKMFGGGSDLSCRGRWCGGDFILLGSFGGASWSWSFSMIRPSWR